jgi:peptidoglycan hydrolase CwlO-like protein
MACRICNRPNCTVLFHSLEDQRLYLKAASIVQRSNTVYEIVELLREIDELNATIEEKDERIKELKNDIKCIFKQDE